MQRRRKRWSHGYVFGHRAAYNRWWWRLQRLAQRMDTRQVLAHSTVGANSRLQHSAPSRHHVTTDTNADETIHVCAWLISLLYDRPRHWLRSEGKKTPLIIRYAVVPTQLRPDCQSAATKLIRNGWLQHRPSLEVQLFMSTEKFIVKHTGDKKSNLGA